MRRGGGGGCKLYGCVGGKSSAVREQRGAEGKAWGVIIVWIDLLGYL